MAVSGNTTSLSRRTLVAGIGGISASLVAPAVVSLAQEPHPDAVLLELGRLLRLKTEELRAWYAGYVDSGYETPPEVLRYTDQDREFDFHEPDDDRWPGYHAPWPAHALEAYSVTRLKLTPLSEHLGHLEDSERNEVIVVREGKVATLEVWPEALERRQQIIEAAEKYRIAHDARPQTIASEEHESRSHQLLSEQWEIVDAITEEPAHTPDGLAVKALAVQLVDDPDSEIKLGEYPFDELVSSALNGLIRLSKPV
jgi:hypothetical protein